MGCFAWNYYSLWGGGDIKNLKWRKLLFPIGLVIFLINIICMIYTDNYYFQKIVFHSLSPFCFFLMIFGVYYYDFSKWRFLRLLAYYSYNWYLWHPVCMWAVSRYFGVNIVGLLIYMIVSFFMAVFFTIVIEEKFLRSREKIMRRIFKYGANTSN